MGALFGGGNNDGNPPATSLRIQTSLNGQPIAIVHGLNRIAGNLIWYGGFAYTPGGKGGKGGGGKGSAQPQYTVDATMGVCEGPIADIPTVWYAQTITAGTSAFSIHAGSPAQPAEPFIETLFPQYALSYSQLAYVATENLNLGASPELPNFTFEVRGAIGAAVYETATVPSSGALTVTPRYFSLASSVTEPITIPFTAPYQYTPANPFGATTVLANVQGFGSNLPTSGSAGVIDINGRMFTRVSGTPTASGSYQVVVASVDNGQADTCTYTFAAADAGLDVTIIDLAIGPGVYGILQPTVATSAGSNLVDVASTAEIAAGQWFICGAFPAGTVIQGINQAASQIALSNKATETSASVAAIVVVGPYTQVLPGTEAQSLYSISVQPGSYGQYTFSDANAGATILIIDVPDADPVASMVDFLANPRYGCGFPAANIGDLSTLRNYAYATGLFISPAIVTAQAMNDYLKDFSTGLNGEFVWSGGLLTFVPYGDTAISGFGKTYTPPTTPVYTLDDDDFLKNEGTQSVGVSAFTSDDPVICVRKRPSDSDNDVKVEYLDRGNSYNPAIAEVQDDAAIGAYGLRPADTKQLHFFCSAAPALISANLQLGRQQVRNLYTFTVPWYFILLDPMDIVAITDAALGLDATWVRILEVTENQQDSTLTITTEEYLAGTGSVPIIVTQMSGGFTPNAAATAMDVN